MRARYLPLLSLLAACAGGAAASESSPAPAAASAETASAETASTTVDPLECAQKLLSGSYQKEGGSVEAGFLRFTTSRPRGGTFRLPYDATLLTVTRTNGVLYVEGPSFGDHGTRYNEYAIRGLRNECKVPVMSSPRSAARGD